MRISSFVHGLGVVGLLLLALAFSPGCSNDGGGTPTPPSGLELNSAVINANDVYAHTFSNAGTFPYHCRIHGASMRDTIRVDTSSSNTNVAVSIVGKAFVPRGSTVRPGGRVTWTNDDGTDHTVTSD